MHLQPQHAPDHLTRFLLADAGVRGVHVALRDTWAQVLARNPHPAAIRELLGEALAASALFTGHAKVDGRLSVQLGGQDALRMLFAECTAGGTLRGIARLAGDGALPDSRDLRELAPGAVLAITIENPGSPHGEPVRYQGLVPMEADSLSSAFEDYFRQSEQLPTRVLLAADGERAAGLMLQKLPGDGGDGDGWTRASALFDTLSTGELLKTPVETLVLRLFHEDAPQLLGGRDLRFGCSCSQERVESMLQSLGREEAEAALVDGSVRVGCEFCGQQYTFDAGELAALFAHPEPLPGATERLQ